MPITQAVGLLLVIALAERIGIPIVTIIKKLLRINGNGVKGQLETIKENDLHHIADKLDVIIMQNKEELLLLRTIKEDIRK